MQRAVVLTIANQKGGVGKTTTAVSVGAALARAGKRVLLLDLDPHANASIHLRIYPEETPYTMYDVFMAQNPESPALWRQVRIEHETAGFDVVPGSVRLAELEIDLRERPGKGALLRTALEAVRQEYDYIVLDCPPHVGILLVNALVAADWLIIPIQTDFLALHGLKLLFDTIGVLNKVLPAPVRYRVLPTLYDKRAGACSRVLELLSRKMGHSMFTTTIGMDTRFREASAHGRVIYEIAPNSRGAKQYEALAQEIMAL